MVCHLYGPHLLSTVVFKSSFRKPGFLWKFIRGSSMRGLESQNKLAYQQSFLAMHRKKKVYVHKVALALFRVVRKYYAQKRQSAFGYVRFVPHEVSRHISTNAKHISTMLISNWGCLALLSDFDVWFMTLSLQKVHFLQVTTEVQQWKEGGNKLDWEGDCPFSPLPDEKLRRWSLRLHFHARRSPNGSIYFI